MLPLAFTPSIRTILTDLRLAFSAAETKILRRLRVFSRPAPVRIKIHATAK